MPTIKERFEALQRYLAIAPLPGETLETFAADDVLALAEQLDREDKDAAAFGLACLSPEARLEAMAPWCSHCGGANPCNCMRDD